MNRRDTIIIAVLINTGLLAALFLMALHTEAPTEFIQTETIAELEPIPLGSSSQVYIPVTEQTKREAHDEIDEVLQNYSKIHSTPVVKDARPRELIKQSEPTYERNSVSISQEEYVQVKVKKGDFLEKIARANGTTVNAIMMANQMQNERISTGQVLLIPKKKDVVQNNPSTPSRSPVNSREPEYYTIKSGDNPWKIAKQFHVRFDELLNLNNLDESKARNLKPGDVLRVR